MSKKFTPIPQYTQGWDKLINGYLGDLFSRVEALENLLPALLQAIQKDLPAIIEHCPDTARAAAEIAMKYLEDE